MSRVRVLQLFHQKTHTVHPVPSFPSVCTCVFVFSSFPPCPHQIQPWICAGHGVPHWPLSPPSSTEGLSGNKAQGLGEQACSPGREALASTAALGHFSSWCLGFHLCRKDPGNCVSKARRTALANAGACLTWPCGPAPCETRRGTPQQIQPEPRTEARGL